MAFAEGYALMAGNGIRHLALADARGRLCGVLSESNFVQALGAEELLVPRTVADLMTRDPITLPPQASVAEALALMAERHISSVLITESSRALGKPHPDRQSGLYRHHRLQRGRGRGTEPTTPQLRPSRRRLLPCPVGTVGSDRGMERGGVESPQEW